MGTALIASTYDNLMNYVQALFSIFKRAAVRRRSSSACSGSA
jgi:hypothetical protein